MSVLLRRASPEDFAAQAINDFQGETAEITGAPEPLLLRSAIHILAAMVVGALCLMAVAKLERVVIASGRIVSESPTLLVQPLETSIVRSINVRPGQEVRKGDVLATLDPTFSAADLSSLQTEAERLRAEIARLEAEKEGRDFAIIEDSPFFQLQMAIWRARQAEYRSMISRSKQLIDTANITIARASDDVKHYRTRLGLASDVEGMRKELERSKIGSRLNSLIAEDVRVEISRNLAEAENTIRAARNDLEVQRSDQEVFIQKWHGAVIKDLLDRRAEFHAVQERLAKAQRRWEMVDLRAVEDAVVLEVADFSVGAVVQPAEKLITLVPTIGQYFAEVDVDAADQGFIAAGQPVKIKFSAYPYIKHGTGEGVVRTISADSFSRTEDRRDINRGRLPERFYRARIDVTDLALRGVPDDFQLTPGMPLSADIVVGQRTILSYLLEGAMRGALEGMREP
ncbi:HlyD family type I secretion periplasmic adaptor subunit [Azospirillum halopraeferens]|uniref:HlyD family type I secretion periplasmic adaptor subunit n=1 Tax=Azospirillum halopraeferens TaxID=34010 RepID=UPI000406FCDF|nr:HlyD family type I secretion periplasmic adaptor subunit [Azospirillum halopraeferens]